MIFHTQILEEGEAPDFKDAVLFEGYPKDPAMIASSVAEDYVDGDGDVADAFNHRETVDVRVAVWVDEDFKGVWLARVRCYLSYYAESTPETPYPEAE